MRALVVVDYQTDFVTGSLGSEAAAAIEDSIACRVAEYRRTNGRIIFTMDTHRAGYRDTHEGRRIPVEHCIDGTVGWRLHGKIAGLAMDEEIIRKDSFGSMELIGKLEGCNSIELCGVATNICVLANAAVLRSAFPEADIIVRRDCVASYDADLHLKALDVMRSLNIDVL